MPKPQRDRLNATRHNGDYVPPWVGDPDAEDGRSIVENDAIRAEHPEPLGTCVIHGDYWTEDCTRCDWGRDG